MIPAGFLDKPFNIWTKGGASFFIIKWVCGTDWTKSLLHPTTITGSDFYDEFSSGLQKKNAEKGLVVFFSSLDGSF